MCCPIGVDFSRGGWRTGQIFCQTKNARATSSGRLALFYLTNDNWLMLVPVRSILGPNWLILVPVRSILCPNWLILAPDRSILGPNWLILALDRSIFALNWLILAPDRSILCPNWSILALNRLISTPNRLIHHPQNEKSTIHQQELLPALPNPLLIFSYLWFY